MERYACNFLASLAQPPLSNPLRRDLYLTIEGEERVPFDLYVQSRAANPKPPFQDSSSLAFTSLPAELQLHILTFCSAPTLFQLMRVSSFLRKEASKLFWARPDAYFVIEAFTLFEGGHAGYTFDDLGFLANVQNVQVNDDGVSDVKIYPMKKDHTCEVRRDGIASFWNVLQKTCPKVRRVVINRSQGPNAGRNETHSVPQAMQLLVQSSPPGIMASAFVIERADEQVDIPSSIVDAIYASSPKWQRALYQPLPDGSWEKTKSHKDWKVVLPPAKPFLGPVGRYYKLRYKISRLNLEGNGFQFIMAECLYRHFSESDKNETFRCTRHYCGGSFQSEGEWLLHNAVMHHVPKYYEDWDRVGAYRWLPKEIKAEFKHRAATLTKKFDEINIRDREMCEEWKQSSHEQQTEIRRFWAEQLEKDPLWETGEKGWMQSRLWGEFCCRFPYKGQE